MMNQMEQIYKISPQNCYHCVASGEPNITIPAQTPTPVFLLPWSAYNHVNPNLFIFQEAWPHTYIGWPVANVTESYDFPDKHNPVSYQHRHGAETVPFPVLIFTVVYLFRMLIWYQTDNQVYKDRDEFPLSSYNPASSDKSASQ